ncbi:MAG: LytR C-terminal domain-containing protein [Micrococcales bacterium]
MEFPRDEFDAAPIHGGRHRVRRTARHRVLEFLKIAAYSAVVAVLGFVGLKAIDSLNFFDTNTVVATQPVVETLKPLVVVLDGTTKDGNATAVAKTLLNAGYNVGTAANYLPATGGQVSTSAVYYLSANDQALAQAIAKKLSTSTVTLKASMSAEFTDAITVVLGTDLN